MSILGARAANDAFNNDEEQSGRNQRRRIDDDEVEHAESSVNLGLTDLNDNVLVKILSFLSFNDLNEVAMCSQRCRAIRSHESLNQTRVGTIVFTERTTRESFCRARLENDWIHVFSGNRIHLKIVGLEQVQNETWRSLPHFHGNVTLTEVAKLSVSTSQENLTIGQRTAFFALLFTLPCLREINANNLKLGEDVFTHTIGRNCPDLERVAWTGCDALYLDGGSFRSCSSLTELILDDYQAKMACQLRNAISLFAQDSGDTTERYMWHQCPHLERLSMKNAGWTCYDMDTPEPLPQELLIKMVRHHPKLRWLRSDLSPENVAMLQREKPEIAFVTE